MKAIRRAVIGTLGALTLVFASAAPANALTTTSGLQVWYSSGSFCSQIQGAITSVGHGNGGGDAESVCSDTIANLGSNFTAELRYINFVNNVHYTCGDTGAKHGAANGASTNINMGVTQTNTSGVCARTPGVKYHTSTLVQFNRGSGVISSGWQNSAYSTY